MELISEYTCRACSLRATLAKLVTQRDRLAALPSAAPTPAPPAASTSALAKANAFDLPPDPAPAPSTKMSAARKERRRKVQRLVERVEGVVEAGDFEKELGDEVKVERVAGPAGKQVRFARTPDVLTFHLNRSSHFGNGAYKNSARVVFPEVLDLSAFSDHPSNGPAAGADAPPRELYRLASLVEHYGSHSFGHYVAYRRRPTPTTPGTPAPTDTGSAADGTIRDGPAPASEWLHISDETVSPAHLNDALRANPFLIFYERVREPIGADGTVGEVGSVARDEAATVHGGVAVVPRVVQRWGVATGSPVTKVVAGGDGAARPEASVDSTN